MAEFKYGDGDKCVFIPETPHVFMGWGCCQCRCYNGLQRLKCRSCGHERCPGIPTAESQGLCMHCGVPLGVSHTPECPTRHPVQ
jgi:hypothetical protein